MIGTKRWKRAQPPVLEDQRKGNMYRYSECRQRYLDETGWFTNQNSPFPIFSVSDKNKSRLR